MATAADFGGGLPRAMLAPDAERRVTAEKEKIIIFRVGVSATVRTRAPYRRYRRTDAKHLTLLHFLLRREHELS